MEQTVIECFSEAVFVLNEQIKRNQKHADDLNEDRRDDDITNETNRSARTIEIKHLLDNDPLTNPDFSSRDAEQDERDRHESKPTDLN